MATKFYIELEDSQFIVSADNAGQAIALLWCRELKPLQGCPEDMLQYFRWQALQLEPEYFIHSGQREHGEYIHSRVAVQWLVGWQIRAAVECLSEVYGIECVQDFFPTEQ